MNSRKKRFWKVWKTRNAQLADKDVKEANRIRNAKFSICAQPIKEISLKELEDIARKVMPEYPKYLGNGLWELHPGCYTGQRGYEMFVEEMMKVDKEELK